MADSTKTSEGRALSYLTDAGLVQRVWTRDNADLSEEILARLNERQAEIERLRTGIENFADNLGGCYECNDERNEEERALRALL